FRLSSAASSTRDFAARPHRFVQIAGTAKQHSLVVAKVSSERRPYLPVDLLDGSVIVSDLLFALYDAPLWNLAVLASRLHLVWIATVCGKMKTDFRYSNTIGWNTFPLPKLTEKNIDDLTRCAQEILLARERHYPQTLAELYAPDAMPTDLLRAHERNDEVVERIYIGRLFKNDTERLEKLFELYSRMSGQAGAGQRRVKRA
ncbi:lactate dehydrogenase, partial [Pseudomonas aeruginosa]